MDQGQRLSAAHDPAARRDGHQAGPADAVVVDRTTPTVDAMFLLVPRDRLCRRPSVGAGRSGSVKRASALTPLETAVGARSPGTTGLKGHRRPLGFGQVRVLFVCTANICRSPMAAAFLIGGRDDRRIGFEVASAGLLPGGLVPPPEVVATMDAYGLDLRAIGAAS